MILLGFLTDSVFDEDVQSIASTSIAAPLDGLSLAA
jgi:hypothetical protein